MKEQSTGANQIVQAVSAMRQGAASTVRALSEQATASEQVSRETDRLAKQIARISKAMVEQATGVQEITFAADNLGSKQHRRPVRWKSKRQESRISRRARQT